ncbi:MAG: uracil-DNA glycosylase [Gammaproteobacteria bacterium]|nr:uracil-DNA glycosylase [Gammaproteobacteria bacterium]
MLDARRRSVLDAMGIDVWCTRGTGEPVSVQAPATSDMGLPVEPARGPRPAVLDRVEDRALTPAAEAGADPGMAVGTTTALGPRVSDLNWEELRVAVPACTACQLHQARTRTVFGVGSESADLMIVGEAPGAEEDRQGEPFVGRAGQLLNAMLAAIGLERQQVYIANIIKCRPPGNRDPHRDEADACRDYLLRQIALIRPRVLLSVGRISAHNLLGCDDPVGRLRGRTHRFEPGDIPLVVTYHPAYLLRRPEEKAKAWADLQAVARQLGAA